MYDIKPLEEQWERYNRKRKRPFYIRILLFILLGIVGFFLFENKSFLLKKFETINQKVSQKEKKHVSHFWDSEIETLALKQVSEKVKPVTTQNDDNPMNPEDVYVDEGESREGTAQGNSSSSSKKRSRKKMNLEIVEINGESVYQDVKNRFSLAPDPDDSLFLARNYFKDKKYKQAAHWALETNKLNGDIEESWLIFAESKAKTGQRNEAIRVLSSYVSKSGSVKAQKLLKKLKK